LLNQEIKEIFMISGPGLPGFTSKSAADHRRSGIIVIHPENQPEELTGTEIAQGAEFPPRLPPARFRRVEGELVSLAEGPNEAVPASERNDFGRE
jgi:hypothetical protein